MQFVQFTAARADTGAVLPYATATVFLTGTTILAPLFNTGGAALANPLKGDASGLLSFAAPDGLYDVAITSADGSYAAPKITRLQLVDLVNIAGTITSGRLGYGTWAELAAITPTSSPVSAVVGQIAEVPLSDTDTHTDPAGGTVNNAGVFRLQAGPAGWHRIYDGVGAQVATSAAQAQAAAGVATANLPVARAFSNDGNFAKGSTSAFNTAGIGGGTFQPTADAIFATYGCANEVVFTSGSAGYFEAIFPRRLRPGEWIAGSVLVWTSDASKWPPANSDGFKIAAVDANGAQTALYLGNDYEQIDATHRRYRVVGQNGGTTDWVKAFVAISGATGQTNGFSGFAIGLANRKPSDVEWENWDPDNRLIGLPVALPIPIRGNLPTADLTQFFGASLSGGALQPTTDAVFSAYGCVNEAVMPATGSAAYLIVGFPRRLRPKEWFAASVLVRTSDPTKWPTPNSGGFRAILTATDNSQQSFYLGNDYEAIDATHRRYKVVGQNAGPLDATGGYICFSAPNGQVPLSFSGFAIGLSNVKPSDVLWESWDFGDQASQNARLTALESGLSASQPTADLLVPSSYNIVAGKSLRLYRDGFTSAREASVYEVAATCINGNDPGAEAYANPLMSLDAASFSGAGFIRAKPRLLDTITYQQKPVTFYTSPAAKTGSPVIHHIGDSTTFLGQPSALRSRLTAAGVTPTFVGTQLDANQVPCEGRSTWKATDFVYMTRQMDGGAQTALYPLRPNGGSGLTISTTVSGGGVASATASGGTGYPNGTWELVFDPPSAGNLVPARGKIAVAGGVPGTITIDVAGTGYTSPPTAAMVPSITEYLALSTANATAGQRWSYNPYIRPATAAEVSANDPRIQNGYIFDFGYYLSSQGLTTPTMVFICLGMNDVIKGITTMPQAFAAIKQIYTAVRAFSANIQVAIAMSGQAQLPNWALFVQLNKLLLAEYNGRETSDEVSLLPLYQAINKYSYPVAAPTATDPQTGQQTVTLSDPTHYDLTRGMQQVGDMLFAYAMCRLP